MHLPRVLAVTAAATLLISAGPSVSAATGGSATRAGKWTAAEAPLPANADHTYAQLSALSCPTASACTAVGSYTSPAGWQGLLLTKANRKWSPVQAPLPAGAARDPYVQLGAVNCYSAWACVALGSYYDSSGDRQNLLLSGAGSSWTAVKAPLPSDAAIGFNGGDLSAVHCLSATSCVAVGDYLNTAGSLKGVVLTGFGRRWTAKRLPVPANAAPQPEAFVVDMSCPASGCVVAGGYQNASGDQEGMLITESRSSWTATEAPVPANASSNPSSYLNAVRCQSSSRCTAVGTYAASSGQQEGQLITGFGTSWTATEAPLPADAYGDVLLDSLACPDPSECLAVGQYRSNNLLTGSAGLLVTGSGSSWTAAQARQPGNTATGAGPLLQAVACSSAAACVVSGFYGIASGGQRAVLIYGGASSWTAIQAPTPPNAGAGTSENPASYVPAVSCVNNASACVAVGLYYDQSGYEQGLLLTGPP